MSGLLIALKAKQDLKTFLENGYIITPEDATSTDDKEGKTALWYAVDNVITGSNKTIKEYALLSETLINKGADVNLIVADTSILKNIFNQIEDENFNFKSFKFPIQLHVIRALIDAGAALDANLIKSLLCFLNVSQNNPDVFEDKIALINKLLQNEDFPINKEYSHKKTVLSETLQLLAENSDSDIKAQLLNLISDILDKDVNIHMVDKSESILSSVAFKLRGEENEENSLKYLEIIEKLIEKDADLNASAISVFTHIYCTYEVTENEDIKDRCNSVMLNLLEKKLLSILVYQQGFYLLMSLKNYSMKKLI